MSERPVSPENCGDANESVLDYQVAQALALYLERVDAGNPPDLNTFLNDYPHIHDALRACLHSLRLIEGVAEQLAERTSLAGDSAANSTVGDFQIVREIGRGGMGVVYEALQISLGRRVALKVLPFASMLDQQQLRRFKNEAHAAAMLHHPHIVSVFSIGCERGVHFYAMPLIDGRNVQELIAAANGDLSRHKVSPDDGVCPSTTPVAHRETALSSPARTRARHVARLGIDAAHALAYAHREGVIHRDIKPSNLLIDADGKLWITDFGLASIQGEGAKTLTGNIVGTLRYMSPEQLAGDCVVDQRTDIYSLGLTLYELLTLRPAFADGARPLLIRQIQERDPAPMRQVDSTIPTDLATIIERAISKDRDLRYRTTQDLADDLQRFLDHRPVHARPLGRLGRTWRWCRRSPAFTGLLAAVVLLLLGVTVTSVVIAVRETAHRRAADAATEEAQWQQYLSDMHSAMAAWEQSNVGRTLELLERHRPGPGAPDLRGFEWNFLWRQCHDKRLKLTINETSFIWGVSFSHDGQFVATGNHEGLVRVWNATNGWLIHEFKDHQYVGAKVEFSPDDRMLASADSEGEIHLRQIADSHTFRTLRGHPGQQISRLLFSNDGKRLASSGEDTTVRIWDVATGGELQVIRPQLRKSASSFVVSPWTDNRLWVVGRDGVMRLFDTDTGMELRSLERKELAKARSTASVSWDGRLAATSGPDGVVRLFETETGRDLETLGAHGAPVRELAFSPDNLTLASFDVQGKAILWDLASRTPRSVLIDHSGAGRTLAFSRDGQRLCTSGSDYKLRIWDVAQSSSAADVCQGHEPMALCVAFSPDGRRMASGGSDAGGGVVMLWDVATGRLEHKLQGHTAWVWQVAFSPDGQELASTGADGTVRLWDLTERRLRITIDSAKELKTWVTYSRDGRQLISSEWLGMLRVWDRSTGAEIRSTKIGETLAEKPALSPDGRNLVAGLDGSIVWLEYPSLKTVRRFPHSSVYGRTVAFAPDGNMIATCDENSNHVYLSSLDGTRLANLDHASSVWCVDFSPDGRTIVTGDSNNEVHIWDVQRREKRATLRGHFAWVGTVRFSPDGKTIASTSNDGTVRLWRSAPPD